LLYFEADGLKALWEIMVILLVGLFIKGAIFGALMSRFYEKLFKL